MRPYKKVLVWENNRRLIKLVEFRDLVIKYFENSRIEWGVDNRIEENAAREARTQINRVMIEIHDIIRSAGLNPIMTYTPPPAVGGQVQKVDVIHNIFHLNRVDMGMDKVLDFVDRVIGIYESNHKSAIIRMLNPFFLERFLSDLILDSLFLSIEKIGFKLKNVESSTINRLTKRVISHLFSLILFMAALLTIMHFLDFLEPVKKFVHVLLGFQKANGQT